MTVCSQYGYNASKVIDLRNPRNRASGEGGYQSYSWLAALTYQSKKLWLLSFIGKIRNFLTSLCVLCRCRILPAQLSRLSVFRKSHVASFQGRAACRFNLLEGLIVITTVYLPTLTHYAWVSRLWIKDIDLTHRGQCLTPDSQIRTTCSLTH